MSMTHFDAEAMATKTMMEALLRPLAAIADRSDAVLGAGSEESAGEQRGGASDKMKQDNGINFGGKGGHGAALARDVIKLNGLLQQHSGRGRLHRLRRDAHISRVVLEVAGNVLSLVSAQEAFRIRAEAAEAELASRARAAQVRARAMASWAEAIDASAPVPSESAAPAPDDRDGSLATGEQPARACEPTSVPRVESAADWRATAARRDRSRAACRDASFRLLAATGRKASVIEVGEVFVTRAAMAITERGRASARTRRESEQLRQATDAWGKRRWLRFAQARAAAREVRAWRSAPDYVPVVFAFPTTFLNRSSLEEKSVCIRDDPFETTLG